MTAHLLVVGDSIAYGYYMPPGADFAAKLATGTNLTLVNRAVPGSQIAYQRTMLSVDSGSVALACALVGFNDMRAGTDLVAFRADLDAVIAMLKSRADRVLIGNCLRMPQEGYTLGAPTWSHGNDMAVVAMNVIIKDACITAGVTYVDACALYDPSDHIDHVHPGRYGHICIAAAFLAHLL